MKTLTIFTPTYNRKHTIFRTYESLCRQTSRDFNWLIIDDGSTDGTRKWVESLGEKIISSGVSFDWMGRPLSVDDANHFVILSKCSSSAIPLRIEYIYKPNGGLYTGYNVAYASILTELCVCIDSDDFMPDDAVEKIVSIWEKRNTFIDTKIDFCGLVGLDFNVKNNKPIGGLFPANKRYAFFEELNHGGDSKQVLRTDLMKLIAPQVGFEGEKDFNPYYMIMAVCDQYPILIANENLCWVEYQTESDSMSAGIWKQYVRSPRSYARYRIRQLQMKHGLTFKRRIELCIHYVSSCILSRDIKWLRNSPSKLLTLFVAPLGCVFTLLVKYKGQY